MGAALIALAGCAGQPKPPAQTAARPSPTATQKRQTAAQAVTPKQQPTPAVQNDSKIHKLTAPDGVAKDSFGDHVALAQNWAVIGATGVSDGDKLSQGAAYLFERSHEGWQQVARFGASDGARMMGFGASVATDGRSILIGAPGGNNLKGAAYLYQRQGEKWAESRLTASDSATFDNFGIAVKVAQNTALVGAQGADYDGHVNGGAVYVFTKKNNTWQQTAKLTMDEAKDVQNFGASIAFDGDIAVIGAPGSTVSGKKKHGTVHIFQRTSADRWHQVAALTASNDSTQRLAFGKSVAVDGNLIAVGAEERVFLYRRSDPAKKDAATWSQVATIRPKSVKPSSRFGHTVTLRGQQLAVGAPGYRVNNQEKPTGTVYLFEEKEGAWTEREIIDQESLGIGSETGTSVSLLGAHLLIGARRASGHAEKSGAAYIYPLSQRSQ